MVKNQKLPANILTPTTKAADHDVLVTPDEIVQRGLMTRAEYDDAGEEALKLFEYGQGVAMEHGLILVDTKYEFGKASDGTIMSIDEVHTLDLSRHWTAHPYQARFWNGLEPENMDKVLPDAPEELVSELVIICKYFGKILKVVFQLPKTFKRCAPYNTKWSKRVVQFISDQLRPQYKDTRPCPNP
ncbi:hypothetical protein M9H77_17769 [Catharanthus roseus]|uniref:Uncharacterized protein n=1 Tax=Catharanthus roseus TaxID=4058 RepID=A0ACC0B5K3_CATRO|nr:hypothetical protein M9H77_17769 [Catharanthus roseus]